MILKTLLIIAVFAAMSSTSNGEDPRSEFIREVTEWLLDVSGPEATSSTSGWQGVVLVTHAIPDLEAVYRNYTRSDDQQSAVARAFEVIDRPLSVNNGLASYADGMIPEIWMELLGRVTKKPSESDPVLPALYLEADPVSEQREIIDASPEYLKFQEYRDDFIALRKAALEESGGWRARKRLLQFTSINEAMRTIDEEWTLFGYKHRTASSRVGAQLFGDPVLRSLELLEDYTVGPRVRQPIVKSWLSPPPDTWRKMPSWIKRRSKTFDGAGHVDFELCRVRIIRPWFCIDDLVSGELQFDKNFAARNVGYVFSEGRAPSLLDYPHAGRLDVYAEELVLVRNIVYDAMGRDSKHPLDFSFSDINLLGYVVRVLPTVRVPSKEEGVVKQ